MQYALRLQIPAHIPPHAVWHAYSLRLKASQKHQISRHNTEKLLPCCKKGRAGRNEAMLSAWRRNRNTVFFKMDFYQYRSGKHTPNKPVFMAMVQIWKFLLLTLSSATTPPHHAYHPAPRTECCSHLLTGKAETPGSHMTHGRW